MLDEAEYERRIRAIDQRKYSINPFRHNIKQKTVIVHLYRLDMVAGKEVLATSGHLMIYQKPNVSYVYYKIYAINYRHKLELKERKSFKSVAVINDVELMDLVIVHSNELLKMIFSIDSKISLGIPDPFKFSGPEFNMSGNSGKMVSLNHCVMKAMTQCVVSLTESYSISEDVSEPNVDVWYYMLIYIDGGSKVHIIYNGEIFYPVIDKKVSNTFGKNVEHANFSMNDKRILDKAVELFKDKILG